MPSAWVGKGQEQGFEDIPALSSDRRKTTSLLLLLGTANTGSLPLHSAGHWGPLGAQGSWGLTGDLPGAS